MVNKVILIGRLGQNPEIRYTQGGGAVANFSVALSEKWTDKQGQKQERVEWVRVVVWEKLAEICAKFLVKGALAYFEGKLQTREWTDKEGNKRQSTEVVVSNMRMLDSKSERQDDAQQPDGYEPGMFG